jgi:transcriptional regulator with XRE-family HTH domain
VIAIREAKGMTIYELANQYGVSKSLISSIRTDKIWRHVNA